MLRCSRCSTKLSQRVRKGFFQVNAETLEIINLLLSVEATCGTTISCF
jgi:hypothetical protein